MTTAQLVQTADRQDRDQGLESGRQQPLCAVCDHELANHDPIGMRYCQATQVQALARKCICPYR